MQHEQSKTCDCIISDGHKTTSKKQERIILVLEKKKRRKRTHFGTGTAVSISRPFVNERNRLMLGEGKRKRKRKTVSKQKGSFIAPIVTTLAPTAIDLVKKLIRYKIARRDRIVMVKGRTPKKVMLPNGRTFYARYKQATRTDLPTNVPLERPYKQRAAPKGRRCGLRQGRRGFKSAFGKLKRFAKKVGNNKAFKNVVGAVLKEVPGAIGNLSKRVKHKKLKLILDSDITKTGIDLATGYALDNLNN